MMNQLFRKRLTSVDECESGFKKVLGSFDLILLGIGAIIGTGVFVLTGLAAATQAGPAVILSFVIAGFACAFAALAYSELSSSVGGCGSAYGYSYAAFGEIVAWIIGWDLILEYGVAVAAVSNGWSGYLNNGMTAIGIGLPHNLTRGPFAVDATGLPDPGLVNLPAFLIILVLMVLLCKGVKESAKLNNAMVFVKVSAIMVFIGVALFHVNPANWEPFMPFGWFQKAADGTTTGILAGASMVFFAYVGFDAVSTAVEETKNPKRDIPIGILGSLAFCTVIYIMVAGLLTGVLPYTQLNVSSPVAYALGQLGINWASALVATGVIAGLTTVMLVLYYGLTRIIFAISRDGLLPGFFSKIDEKTHTPVRTTVLCGFVMAVTAGFLPYGLLVELVNVGTLFAFVLVCGGVIVLRIKHPDMPRAFKTPFGILFPVLGMLSCAALIAFLPSVTHMRFGVWLALGFVLYFFYSYKNSKLAS
ncbi:MAG: APC family permease [Alphaproteobacteria bacterium]